MITTLVCSPAAEVRSGVRNTRHDSPTGSDSCANGSPPLTSTVGEPLNRSRAASSAVATWTNTTCASTSASARACRSRPSVSCQLGQPENYSSSTFTVPRLRRGTVRAVRRAARRAARRRPEGDGVINAGPGINAMSEPS